MRVRDFLLFCGAVGFVVTIALWMFSAQVVSAPTLGPSMAIENISPGQSGPAWSVACDANVDACVFEYDQGDDDNTTLTDFLPIAHGSRITVMLRDDAEVTCCVLPDPTTAITSLIGSQAANTTRTETTLYNGTSTVTRAGPCFGLEGAGSTWTETVSWFALAQGGFLDGFGVCDAETANNRWTGYDVFTSCADDADCNDVGGTPASTSCDRSRAPLNFNRDDLPAVYMGCRSSAAADISYWLTR